MTRPLTVTLLCASLGLLSGRGEAPTPLPPVSAQPFTSPDSGPTAESLPIDPAADSVLEELRWRHTGLSDRDLRQLARTLVAESRRQRIDPGLVLAVLQVESGGYNFAVSNVGAMGLMQLMPATGEQLARRMGQPWWGPETLFDPVVNVTLGVAYLKQLSDRFGSWPAALAAYNWGPGNIGRRIRRGTALPSSYVGRVMRLYDASSS